MILQALADYYTRKAESDSTAVAPPGFEKKEMPFLIVLDREGKFVDLEDTRSGVGRKRKARVFAVPQGVKRTVAVRANLLWDNPGYVFGWDTRGKVERAREQFDAFVAQIEALTDEARSDPGVAAVLAFLKRGQFEEVFAHPRWEDVAAGGANLSFRLQGVRHLACQSDPVVAAITASSASTPEPEAAQRCLVTGERDRIARLHPAIKGVWGAQTSGANIVSFNLDAFRSFGREQGANAPVGERATFAYTTALNHLLGKESRQRLQVADASTVFWAQEASPLEDSLANIFAEPPRNEPDRNIDAVRSLYRGPESGNPPIDSDPTRFYILGLAPNAARIAVRFWHVSTVGELAKAIRQHFDDLEIVRSPFDPPVLSLFRLLVSTAALGKAENIRPNLAAAMMQSILTNAAYPRELLGAALQRNRAEQQLTYSRASLIKAVLVREARRDSTNTRNPEVGVSLDPNHPRSSYHMGRLFAVLERIQEESERPRTINRTIRDAYFGSASMTPAVVFPRLLRLKVHHLNKIDSPKLRGWYENQLGEIIDHIDMYDSVFDLADQGYFSIGYYHQRQHFFSKRGAKAAEAAPATAV